MDAAYEKSAYQKMSPKELFELGKRSAEGDLAAREELILSHLPLANILALKFLNRGVDYDDLYQEACYGLIEAVNRYDYTRGVKLSTYATYWIMKRLRKALLLQNKSYPLTINEKDYYQLCRLFDMYHQLFTDRGQAPSISELAEALELPEQQVSETYRRFPFFVANSEEGNFPQCTSPSAEDEYLGQGTQVDFCGTLLTKREEVALRLYLGLTADNIPRTFKEVSCKTGWSEETIRSSYYSAIGKLRTAFTCQNPPDPSDVPNK